MLTLVSIFYTRNIINKIVWTAAKARRGKGERERERALVLQSASLLAKRAEAPSLALSLSTRRDHELDGGVVFRRIQTD